LKVSMNPTFYHNNPNSKTSVGSNFAQSKFPKIIIY
jgi:hypothetical protein